MQPEVKVDLSGIDCAGIGLDQYFGLWAVEESKFLQMFDQVSKMDLGAHIQMNAGINAAARGSERREGEIAVIDINGTMTKRGSSLSTAGATGFIRRQVRNAAESADVSGIMLVIDSPGGTVSGTQDLANEVAAAAKKKPVHAFIEDLGASAAYWVASQATKIAANNSTAWIGSIGTFMGLYDLSGAAAMQGIKPVVIKTGAYKGAGFPGAEITAEQRNDWQTLVDKTQGEFSAAIARGRHMPMSKVQELADGRVHMASDAVGMGLIDAIQTFDKAMSELRKAGSQPKQAASVKATETYQTRLLAAVRPTIFRSRNHG